MFSGLNSILKDLKHFTLNGQKLSSIVIRNPTSELNTVLTLSMQNLNTSAEEKLFTTGELNTTHIKDSKKYTQDINFSTNESNVKTSSSSTLPSSKFNTEELPYNLGHPKDVAQYTVYAQEGNIKGSTSWNGLVMDGPCPFSNMGKPFSNVLFNYDKNTQKIIKNLKQDDWELKLEHLGIIGVNQCCIKNNIVGRAKHFENCNPYFKVGEENNFGVKSVINENFMNDSCLSLNINKEDRAINSLYSALQFKHQAMVLNSKFQLTKHYQPNKMGFNADLSGVFGHSFEKFGLLGGFSLAKDFADDSEWKEICQAVSLGIVLPSSILRVTLEPNINIMTACLYFKINDKVEIATAIQGNWRTHESLNEKHEVGIKLKHTDNLTLGFKMNFDGNVSTGAWYISNEFKIGLCTNFFVKNHFEEIGKNIGIIVEF